MEKGSEAINKKVERTMARMEAATAKREGIDAEIFAGIEAAVKDG